MKKLLLTISLTVLFIVPLVAQVRFYFTSTSGGTPVSPAFGLVNGGSWGGTTNATRRNMTVTRDGSTMANTTATGTVTLTNSALIAQFISPPLQAQTILNTGYYKLQLRGLCSSTGGNLIVSLKVVSSTGSTVRGWLIEGDFPSTSTFTTSLANRGTAGVTTHVFSGLQSIPGNIVCSAGDYLVLEIGGYFSSGSGTRTFTASLGSNAGADIAEDNSTTTANDPWFYMSQTVLFQSAPTANKGIPLSVLMN